MKKLKIDKELIHLGLECETPDQVIEYLANKMASKGIVKDTYIQAVIDREKVSPTGLASKTIGVAIPHASAEHANKSAVSIGICEQPITFQHMGGIGIDVHVEIVFLMAVDDPKGHLAFLKSVMGILQNGELLKEIRNSPSKDQIKYLMDEALGV